MSSKRYLERMTIDALEDDELFFLNKLEEMDIAEEGE